MPFLTPNQEVKTLKETQSTVLTLFFGNFIRQLALADTHSQELEDFCFTAHMPLLSATSTFKLGTKHYSSLQRCYLHCLCTSSPTYLHQWPSKLTPECEKNSCFPTSAIPHPNASQQICAKSIPISNAVSKESRIDHSQALAVLLSVFSVHAGMFVYKKW